MIRTYFQEKSMNKDEKKKKIMKLFIIRFLKEHGIYNSFHYYLRNRNNPLIHSELIFKYDNYIAWADDFYTIDQYYDWVMKKSNLDDLIFTAFYWSETIQGHAFWSKIDNDFRKELDNFCVKFKIIEQCQKISNNAH